jgi:hypothetical protein
LRIIYEGVFVVKKFFVLAGIAITLLTSACAPSITQQYPSEIAIQQTIPVAQWLTYESRNLSLSLPPSWRAFDERILEAETEDFNDYFPSSLNFTFFAIDLANTSAFETNMTVVEEALPFEMPFEDYVKLSARGIKYYTDVQGDVTHHLIDLPSGKVGYFSYITKIPFGYDSETVAMTQYVFKQEKQVYILSFGSSVELQDVYAPVYEQIAKTVNLTPNPSPNPLPESQLSMAQPVPFHLASFLK